MEPAIPLSRMATAETSGQPRRTSQLVIEKPYSKLFPSSDGVIDPVVTCNSIFKIRQQNNVFCFMPEFQCFNCCRLTSNPFKTISLSYQTSFSLWSAGESFTASHPVILSFSSWDFCTRLHAWTCYLGHSDHYDFVCFPEH